MSSSSKKQKSDKNKRALSLQFVPRNCLEIGLSFLVPVLEQASSNK